MRFDERFLDEIKSRLRPSDVIGRTVKLRKQGREYVGLSPFTKEKTPSFYVNDDKGQFFDFSSGKTGVLIAPEEGGAPYDRFRDRIIFPILDARARVVSFGGRAMDPNARAKYLNGPETAAFHKGHQLYGLSEARKMLAAAPAGEDPPLVVVEGYMDVIACLRAGVP